MHHILHPIMYRRTPQVLCLFPFVPLCDCILFFIFCICFFYRFIGRKKKSCTIEQYMYRGLFSMKIHESHHRVIDLYCLSGSQMGVRVPLRVREVCKKYI